MFTIKNRSLAFGAMLLCLFLSSCAGVKMWPEKKGQVLEVGTNKPIEGAIVVALWTGRRNVAFVDSQSTCYHVETATTDAQGSYTIPSHFDGIMQGNVFNKGIDVHVYKADYVVADKTYKDETYKKGIYLLERFKGARKERTDYLLKQLEITRCSDAGRSTKNYYKLYQAMYIEADMLAITENEKKSALGYKDRANRALMSDGKSHPEVQIK